MVVTPSGNVGIGMAVPTALLQIGSGIFIGEGGLSGDTSVGSDIRFSTAGMISAEAQLIINIDSDNNGTTNYFSVAKDTAKNSGGSELFRVQENGNVGIGTTNPVVGTTPTSLKIMRPNSTWGLAIENSAGSFQTDAVFNTTTNSADSKQLQLVNVLDSFQIRSIKDDDTIGKYFLYVDMPTGNVGIGTTSPAAGLHVVKDDGSGYAGWFQKDGSSAGVGLGSSGATSMIQGLSSNGAVVASLNLNPKGGNVGIGTTSPSMPLTVVSTASNINLLSTVCAGGWCQNLVSSGSVTGDWGANETANIVYAGSNSNHPYVIRVHGIGRVLVDTSGNVGIGTSNPLNNLTLASAGTNSTAIDIKNTATNGRTWSLYSSGGGPATAGYFGLYDNSASSSRLVVDTSGNVGIGTTSPDSSLVVSANLNSQAPDANTPGTLVHFIGPNASKTRILVDAHGTAMTPVLSFRNSRGTAAAPTALQAGDFIGVVNAAGFGTTSYSGNSTSIGFYTTENWTDSAQGSAITFQTTLNGSLFASEKLRIDNTGNVGIGTTTPATTLDVVGSVRSSSYVQSGPGNVAANSGKAIAMSYNVAGDYGTIDSANWGTGGTPLVLQSGTGGNVGIGTTSSYSKLTVRTSGNSSNTAGIGISNDDVWLNMYSQPSTNYLTIDATRGGSSSAPGTSPWYLLLNSSGGYVGIGTTNPSQLLTVDGVERIRQFGSTQYRSDYYLASGSLKINAYDDTGLTYIPTEMIASKFQFTTATTGGASGQMTMLSSGNVGMGMASPDSSLVVSANLNSQAPDANTPGTLVHFIGPDASKTRILVDAHGTAMTPVLSFRNSRGTAAVPTALHAGDFIGVVNAAGFGTTSYSANSTSIGFYTTENWTDSAQGSAITFQTTLNGSLFASERLRIDNTGNVGIGTTSPSALLQTLSLSGFSLPATSGGTQTGAQFRMSSTGATLDFGTVSGGIQWIQATNRGDLSLNYSLLLNPNGGNVGIGITSPTKMLTALTLTVDGILIQGEAGQERAMGPLSLFHNETSFFRKRLV